MYVLLFLSYFGNAPEEFLNYNVTLHFFLPIKKLPHSDDTQNMNDTIPVIWQEFSNDDRVTCINNKLLENHCMLYCPDCEDKEYFLFGIAIGLVAMYLVLHFNLLNAQRFLRRAV